MNHQYHFDLDHRQKAAQSPSRFVASEPMQIQARRRLGIPSRYALVEACALLGLHALDLAMPLLHAARVEALDRLLEQHAIGVTITPRRRRR